MRVGGAEAVGAISFEFCFPRSTATHVDRASA